MKVEEKKIKIRKSLKYLFVPTFLVMLVYYIYIDVVPLTVKTTIDPNLKYILQWTNPYTEPFKFMGHGQNAFFEQKCHVNNCFVTSNRRFMSEINDFDAILFHGPELNREQIALPKTRSPHQKYVFASMESSHYYPIVEAKFENFFNWTWTYKLNSDIYYGYMIIRNNEGDIIGPKKEMHWLKPEEMKPINESLKKELGEKRIAAAWLVSNCNTPGSRETFVKNIKLEFAKQKLTLDVYGKCGPKKCAKHGANNCHDLIKKLYYFYLSFENSFSEDYVTEKLLNAILNNAVPIVYGGANYTRFLPQGSYLNARKLGAKKLVQLVADAIKDKEKYYEYFKWRNHYSYHKVEESPETNYYCKFCSKLNEQTLGNKNNSRRVSFYHHFREWWNYRK